MCAKIITTTLTASIDAYAQHIDVENNLLKHSIYYAYNAYMSSNYVIAH